MWFFMNTCYVLSALTLAVLLTAFLQSFFHFHIGQANHVSFMILASIVYFFTETLVIFFYVGTGVSIKEYTRDHRLDTGFHKRSIAIKRRVYPPLLLNMLFMIILFVPAVIWKYPQTKQALLGSDKLGPLFVLASVLLSMAGVFFLTGLYFGLVSWAEGPAHAVDLFWEDRWIVLPIILGFGIQVALYVILKKRLVA